jgi:hypothetical protein
MAQTVVFRWFMFRTFAAQCSGTPLLGSANAIEPK